MGNTILGYLPALAALLIAILANRELTWVKRKKGVLEVHKRQSGGKWNWDVQCEAGGRALVQHELLDIVERARESANVLGHLSVLIFIVALIGVISLAFLPGSQGSVGDIIDQLNLMAPFFTLMVMAVASPGLLLLFLSWVVTR